METRGKSKEVKRRLRTLIPQATMEDFTAVEEKADAGHLRYLPPSIRAWQALTSYIRHVHTDYDDMLNDGYEPDAARHFVVDDINQKLSEWGCSQTLSDDDQ